MEREKSNNNVAAGKLLKEVSLLTATICVQIGVAITVIAYNITSRISDLLIEAAEAELIQKKSNSSDGEQILISRLPVADIQMLLAGKSPKRGSFRNIVAALVPLYMVLNVVTEVRANLQASGALEEFEVNPSVQSILDEEVQQFSNNTQEPNQFNSLVAPAFPPQTTSPTEYLTTNEYLDTIPDQFVDQARIVIEIGERLNLHPNKQEIIRNNLELVSRKYRNIAIPRFFGFIDDEREIPQVAIILSAIEHVMSVDPRIYLSLEFVIGALSNEGRILDVDYFLSNTQSVSGFQQMGLDIFSDEYAELQENRLLPETLVGQFQHSYAVNELGQSVNSAVFNTKESAIQAFIATLALRQQYFLSALDRQEISLDELSESEQNDVIQFFTYIYYNAGATVGNNIVRDFNTDQDLKLYFNRASTNPSSINLSSAPANAYVVMSGAEWLRLSREAAGN